MYYLMNKDYVLLSFEIQGEGIFETCIEIDRQGLLPPWFRTIEQWVSARSVAKHRKHIQKILSETGGNTLSGFIRLTHCLSLNDTLWVKSDCEILTWDKVSLYRNKFNDVISKLSFDGAGLYGEQMSVTSPELTTDGNFDKCWKRENGTIKLLKAGSSGAGNAGREPYSEVLASQVFEKICGTRSVQYNLTRFNGRAVSECKLFTSEKYGYRSAAVFNLTGLSITELLREYDKFGDVDIFKRMLIADAVCINTDRHYGNFGFLVDNDTFERVSMAPVFDFNLAMFPYADWQDGFSDMETWISERGPRIGTNYYEVAKALLTSEVRSELINLKDLDLVVETDDKFPTTRLRIVNEFKNVQIDKILGNKRQFNFEPFKVAEDVLDEIEV